MIARDLQPGDRVIDNFTPWAEVVTVEPSDAGIRVEWRLADGRREVETYRASDEFTPAPYPDPWGPGGKFIESGLQPVEDDPCTELFADCTTTEEVLELQAEIDAAND